MSSPLPTLSASRTSGRSRWFSMPARSLSESKSTPPSGVMRVMRKLSNRMSKLER